MTPAGSSLALFGMLPVNGFLPIDKTNSTSSARATCSYAFTLGDQSPSEEEFMHLMSGRCC